MWGGVSKVDLLDSCGEGGGVSKVDRLDSCGEGCRKSGWKQLYIWIRAIYVTKYSIHDAIFDVTFKNRNYFELKCR